MNAALLLLALAAWPEPASLHVLESPKPTKKRLRVYLDAGHGAKDNHGNTGCLCQRECDITLDTEDKLFTALEKTNLFELKRSRSGASEPSYPKRLAEAEAWKADVIVSLHTDARGEAYAWRQNDAGTICYRNDSEPGFAVLWSPDGDKPLVAAREKLGRAVSRRLTEAGLLAYDGINYGGLYDADSTDGGFIDIRGPKTRVYFLHASKVPTVIIETHHALDSREVARWDEPETHAAFASAVAAALQDFGTP